jgi:hypothetical protein
MDQLLSESEESIEQENKATQTDIPMRELLVEISDWHCCLNTSCFCMHLVIMHEPSVLSVAVLAN